MKPFSVLDLFCGCGGLSYGFEQAGYNVLLGIDNWKDALVTYQFNHKLGKILQADLSTLQPQKVEKIIGHSVDVVIGGPPCQGYSLAGKRILEDKRNELYKAFVQMVRHFEPKAFVLENVPNILSIGTGIVREAIVNDFSSIGYNVAYRVLTASDYGVPQNRKRTIFVGLKNGNFDFMIPQTPQKVTVAEALSDLPEDSVDDGEPYTIPVISDYQSLMRKSSTGIHNHQITEHNEMTKHIISLVPDGGNYKNLPLEFQGIRKVHIAWTRLNSARPSITIDTGHRHHFHYKYNRVPTVRESARLQSFPDNFIFIGSKTSQYKQVGNAVPPLMAQSIAEYLKKFL